MTLKGGVMGDKKVLFGVVVSFLFFLSACVSVPQKTQYATKTEYDLVDSVEARQTIKDITITLKPLNVDQEIQKEKYVQHYTVSYIPFLETQLKTVAVPLRTNIYEGTVAFEVEIINNTDHILRMRDSRVAYIDPDMDEPVMALDKATIVDDPEILPAYRTVLQYLLKKYRPKNDVRVSINHAFSRIAKKIKFINGFNREILPGMRTRGVILFPVEASEAAEGKISFIDMVARTDKAGNPLERVRFDYRIKSKNRYYKSGPNGEWIEISQDEYQQGINSSRQ